MVRAVTGETAGQRLGVVRDEPDEVRLARFRREHPEIDVRPLSPDGPHQAEIPEQNGSTVITRYTLAELLDKLAELL